MTSLRKSRTGFVFVVLLLAATPAGAAPGTGPAAKGAAAPRASQWRLSDDTMRVGKDRAIGLKLDRHRVMWIGGNADDPADDNTCFIYDTRTRAFRETAPIPEAKSFTSVSAAGVLSDGTVVLAGSSVADLDTGQLTPGNRLSYRYNPRTDRWTRTGDLPEAQEWLFTPTTLLNDGRLLIAGGIGHAGHATGTGSLKAFVFNPRQKAIVDVINPDSGRRTGKKSVVQGKWDYTRTSDGRVSKLHSGHIFGNAALLNDGRVLVGGGHTTWAYPPLGNDLSVLATGTDFFDPATGVWSRGAPFPKVVGEDNRIPNSRGGRTNGVGFAVLDNGKVVIAGGYTASDGEAYFDTVIARQSILVMSPAKNALKSRYRVSPNPIPAGTDFGGLFGDAGRGQVLSYAISRNRVVIAGGQNQFGEDLYDSYIYDDRNSSVTRGPDMVHGLTEWAADPESGYPADYQAPKISTRAVSMNNSKLVFHGDLLVHGGAFDPTDTDGLGSRYVETLRVR